MAIISDSTVIRAKNCSTQHEHVFGNNAFARSQLAHKKASNCGFELMIAPATHGSAMYADQSGPAETL